MNKAQGKKKAAESPKSAPLTPPVTSAKPPVTFVKSKAANVNASSSSKMNADSSKSPKKAEPVAELPEVQQASPQSDSSDEPKVSSEKPSETTPTPTTATPPAIVEEDPKPAPTDEIKVEVAAAASPSDQAEQPSGLNTASSPPLPVDEPKPEAASAPVGPGEAEPSSPETTDTPPKDEPQKPETAEAQQVDNESNAQESEKPADLTTPTVAVVVVAEEAASSTPVETPVAVDLPVQQETAPVVEETEPVEPLMPAVAAEPPPPPPTSLLPATAPEAANAINQVDANADDQSDEAKVASLELTDTSTLNNGVYEALETPNSAKCLTKHELAEGYGFNEDQIGIFEETFQIFDKDCDGFITLVEIRTVMNALGFFPGDDIIRKSIQNIDTDNSGTVDFEEFICMMSKFRKMKTTIELEDELKEIFNIFDKNHDGFIDKAELKDVLIKLGENITDDEVAEMIKEADLDGDNKVSYPEFKSILYDNKHR